MMAIVELDMTRAQIDWGQGGAGVDPAAFRARCAPLPLSPTTHPPSRTFYANPSELTLQLVVAIV